MFEPCCGKASATADAPQRCTELRWGDAVLWWQEISRQIAGLPADELRFRIRPRLDSWQAGHVDKGSGTPSAHCQAPVTSVGKWDGPLRYCSTTCLESGPNARYRIRIPNHVIDQEVWRVHQGNCPKCSGRGPIDLHTSYWVCSPLVVTFWNTRLTLACERCGRRTLVKDSVTSVLFGWWGFPLGPILTPRQVYRNLKALADSKDWSRPSVALTETIRADVVYQALADEIAKG